MTIDAGPAEMISQDESLVAVYVQPGNVAPAVTGVFAMVRKLYVPTHVNAEGPLKVVAQGETASTLREPFALGEALSMVTAPFSTVPMLLGP